MQKRRLVIVDVLLIVFFPGGNKSTMLEEFSLFAQPLLVNGRKNTSAEP